ncbi:MAG: hypothetical protein P3A31_02790 [Gemmatimonadota bacterium]|jgi:hypothetical protein|nr:hypothetical protein [Gemmatimonadota bacterium]MDQ8157514.1 hypothetical protein [Gemmatimonadota bacterium]
MDVVTLALLASHALAPVPDPALPAGPVLTSRFTMPAAPALPADRSDLGVGRFPAPADSAFEYSAAYYTRLDIHRWGSYAMLPLFAFQYLAGRELFEKSAAAPEWARDGHGVAAGAVAGLFAVNTVTGVWNLWEGRNDPQDRGRKVFHAVLMLAADAGFTATGLLADDAEESLTRRQTHRSVALASIGMATIGYASMLDIFR